VIEDVHRGNATLQMVSIIRLGDFVEKAEIAFIDLLRVDIEGND